MKISHRIFLFHYFIFLAWWTLLFLIKSKGEVTPFFLSFFLCFLPSDKPKSNGPSSYLQLSGICVEQEQIYDEQFTVCIPSGHLLFFSILSGA